MKLKMAMNAVKYTTENLLKTFFSQKKYFFSQFLKNSVAQLSSMNSIHDNIPQCQRLDMLGNAPVVNFIKNSRMVEASR